MDLRDRASIAVIVYSFARASAVVGLKVAFAQRIAGHANIKTTQVYDRRDKEVSFTEIEPVGI